MRCTEESYQKVESFDEILPILKDVKDGKILSRSVATGTPETLGEGEEGAGDTGATEGGRDEGQLPPVLQDEGERAGEEDTGLPSGGGIPPSGVGVSRPQRPERLTSVSGGRPDTGGGRGVQPITPVDVVPGEESETEGAEGAPVTRPGKGKPTEGQRPEVQEGVGEPGSVGVPGVDSVIDDLLKLSEQEVKKSIQ